MCLGCYTNVAGEFLFLGIFSQMDAPNVDLGAAEKPPHGFPKPPAGLLLKQLCIIHAPRAPCEQLQAPAQRNKPLPWKIEVLLRCSLLLRGFSKLPEDTHTL